MELWALCAQTTGTALVLVQTGIPELSLGLWLQGKSWRGESGVCPEVWFVPFLVWPHGLRAPVAGVAATSSCGQCPVWHCPEGSFLMDSCAWSWG